MTFAERREEERQNIIRALTAWTGEAGEGRDIADEEIEALLKAWEKQQDT